MTGRYKEESKSVYMRAESLVINNCLPSSGLKPSLRFNEEWAVVNSDETIVSLGPTGTYVVEELNDANLGEQFDLQDSDGNVTGSATFSDVYIMLRSLYKYCSAKRDAAPAPDDPPEGLPDDWPTMNIDQPPPEEGQ